MKPASAIKIHPLNSEKTQKGLAGGNQPHHELGGKAREEIGAGKFGIQLFCLYATCSTVNTVAGTMPETIARVGAGRTPEFIEMKPVAVGQGSGSA